MSAFTFVDLFAGIGGFRLALERLGGRCVAFSEIDRDAIECYRANHHAAAEDNLGDVTRLASLPPHDLLTGGVPCQSWSIAGRNLGFDDARGQLWMDALRLLNAAQPKAFIFENVKGLADPRNHEALAFILRKAAQAGYHARHYLLNAYDYGVPQNRIRVYIIGFRDAEVARRFALPAKHRANGQVARLLGVDNGSPVSSRAGRQSLSANERGLNDYFLLNDLRGGQTTLHSWDLTPTTQREKDICLLLLRNRRKRLYGALDGNPLSLRHLQGLDGTITQHDLDALVDKRILRREDYLFRLSPDVGKRQEPWAATLEPFTTAPVSVDQLKMYRPLRVAKVNVVELLSRLQAESLATCLEQRYDFRNTKISTGLDGVCRIFLPTTRIYPTLVASDTNDYVTDVNVRGATPEEFRRRFVEEVYRPGRYRRISREEACAIQGFPADFALPPARARWMRLIGNSVAVGMIEQLAASVVQTGVFGGATEARPAATPANALAGSGTLFGTLAQ